MDILRTFGVRYTAFGQGSANTQLDATSGTLTGAKPVGLGLIVSLSGAPASAVRGLLITTTGSATVFSFWIPAAASAPIVLPLFGGIRGAANGDALILRVPALGAGVTADAVLFYDFDVR